MAEWFEDPAFWRDNAPYMFHRQRLEQTPEEVDRIVRLLEIKPGARLLDLPCGPGRHAIELARRGFRVTGVDLTEEYLAQARRRAEEAGLALDLRRADMRAFRGEGYDAAINMFTSFGFFRDPADDRRVAENLFATLRPGGRLLMEMMGKEILARVFQPRRFTREENGAIFLAETQITHDWSWVTTVWTVFTEERRFAHTLSHRVYSAVELRTLLEEVGFTRVECFGSLEGVPYDPAAARLVVRATR